MIALPYYLVAAIAAVVTLPARAVRSLTASRATATGSPSAAPATC